MVTPVTPSNVIDPPPRLTGDSKQDTVAIIQWLSAFYVKGILAAGIQQTANPAPGFDAQLVNDFPSLGSLAALTGAADKLAYYTAATAFALTDFTALARTFVASTTAVDARIAIGAGTVTGVGATSPIASSGGNTPIISITDFIASGATHARGAVPDPGAAAGAVNFLREDASWATPTGLGDVVGPVGAVDSNVVLFDGVTGKKIKDGGTLGTSAFTATATPTTLGLVIGANVQAYDADLTTWAGITPTAGISTFLATPSSANLAAALSDEVGSDKAIFGTAWAAFSPSRAGWTDVGAPTVTGRNCQIGNVVHFQIKVVPGTTVATVAGTSYCSLPIAAAGIGGTAIMTDTTTRISIGNCVIDTTNSRVYVPTQTATADTVTISGWYEV